jgi:hypothetical protein
MKNALFLLGFLFLLTSCVEQEPARTDENLIQSLSAGVWEVSFFDINGSIQTGRFEGISFIFYPNGISEAYRGTQLLDQGKWRTYLESGKIYLELTFTNLQELNGEWYQDFIRDSQIIVRRESMNSLLVFEKI